MSELNPKLVKAFFELKDVLTRVLIEAYEDGYRDGLMELSKHMKPSDPKEIN
jgi:hypothetical protein